MQGSLTIVQRIDKPNLRWFVHRLQLKDRHKIFLNGNHSEGTRKEDLVNPGMKGLDGLLETIKWKKNWHMIERIGD